MTTLGGVLCKGVHERLCCATGGGDRDAALKLTSAAGWHGHRAALLPGAQSTQLSLPALQWDGRSGGLLGLVVRHVGEVPGTSRSPTLAACFVDPPPRAQFCSG